MNIDIPEKYARNNTPIKLFEVDGKPIEVKLLSASQAEEWVDYARGIEMIEENVADAYAKLEAALERAKKSTGKNAKSIKETTQKREQEFRKARSEKFRFVCDALRRYSPSIFSDSFFDSATVAQCVWAFDFLRFNNDPLLVTSAIYEEALGNSEAAENLKALATEATN